MNSPKGPETADTLAPSHNRAMGTVFLWIERGVLIVIALLTLAAAALELVSIFEARAVDLADILLMFLYFEVLGMISVFYRGSELSFVYPIFIAITALARLIVLQGKDMAPENILFEAGAILLLSVAAVIVTRTRSSSRARH